MRTSTTFLLSLAAGLILLTAAFVHAVHQQGARMPDLRERVELVQRLRLTDLCLFTEARYTRHPSQADRHAPFQDYPMSLEHFPSGSLLGPPQGTREPYADLD